MEDQSLHNHLELIATADLQAELFKRFDHVIFYGVKHRPLINKPNNHLVSWFHDGDMYKCAGLAARMVLFCNSAIDEMTEEAHPSDL